jgi:hypothetical protein
MTSRSLVETSRSTRISLIGPEGVIPFLALPRVLSPETLHELQCAKDVYDGVKNAAHDVTEANKNPRVDLLTYPKTAWPTVCTTQKVMYYRVALHDELYRRVKVLKKGE